MRRLITFLFALISAGIAATSLVACGGGGGGPEATSVPSTEARTTCKPPANPTPGASRQVPEGMAEYKSPERGYRVLYPADWRPQPNTVAVSNISGDAFFSNDKVGMLTVNVSVTCETVPVGTTSGDFIDAKRTLVQRLTGKMPEVEAELTVNGKEAASVVYTMQAQQTPEPISMEKVDVYFADDMGGWTISLTAPLGAAANYRPTFDNIVRSFLNP